MSAVTIIEKLGGATAIAEGLGLPATTVQSWKDRNNIPAKRQALVVAYAKKKRVKLKHEDFFAECDA